ncbi:MAG: cytochrome c-type biogenesis protein CcmH [Anaerolineae bacterium]
MKQRMLLALLAIAASFFTVTMVQAQAQPTDDEVNAIAKKLYCPVCPNTPLDVCETKACQDWREQIREQLANGWTEEEVIAYFVEQYGERVLAEPERSGFTSLVWILPVVAVVLGLVIGVQALRSWRMANQQGEITAVSPIPDIAPETLAKIESELRDLV